MIAREMIEEARQAVMELDPDDRPTASIFVDCAAATVLALEQVVEEVRALKEELIEGVTRV